MSFEINWEAISASESLERLRGSLNEQINSWHDGRLMDGVSIEELVLGPTPPDLLIEEISDPMPPFWLNAPSTSGEGGGGGDGGAAGSPLDNIQVTLAISYDSPVRVVLRGELIVNYPSAKFISLPLRLLLKRVRLRAIRAVVARVAGRTMISIRRDDHPDALMEYDFDTEIGDGAKHGRRRIPMYTDSPICSPQECRQGRDIHPQRAGQVDRDISGASQLHNSKIKRQKLYDTNRT